MTYAIQTARLARAMLIDAEACGFVPSDVPSFAALHNYCDANMLGGLEDVDTALCTVPEDDRMDVINAAQGLADQWIQDGRLARMRELRHIIAADIGARMRLIDNGAADARQRAAYAQTGARAAATVALWEIFAADGQEDVPSAGRVRTEVARLGVSDWQMRQDACEYAAIYCGRGGAYLLDQCSGQPSMRTLST
jgi:hypothetical protein